jgi:YD repeat-containing protein
LQVARGRGDHDKFASCVCTRRSLLFGIALFLFYSLVAPGVSLAGEQFIYDDLNRLIGVIDESGTQTTYTYDAAGNILSVQSSVSPTQPPSVSSVTPGFGTLGTSVSVTIAGTNLTGAVLATDNAGIAVGGVSATANSIKATLSIGNDARLGNTILTASTAAGSTTANFNIVATRPVLASLAPASGPVTRLVDVAGSGFASDPAQNQVSFNGVATAIISSAPNKITTQVPSGASSGNVSVTSHGLSSNPLPFTVESAGPPPTVNSISPNIGSVEGGVLITVSGSGFVSGTTVKVGGKPLVSPIVQNANTITGIVPATAGTGAVDVIVDNVNGDVFLRGAFSYLAGGRHEIVQLDPAPGAISPTNARITLLFSRPLDRTTVNATSFSVTDGTAPVAGAFGFSLSDTVITFTPSGGLAPNKTYTFQVTQGVKSIDGVPLSRPFSGFVTTSASADTTPPTVKVTPVNGATSVPFNTNITFEFSEPINPISVNAQTLRVADSTGSKNGSVSFSADRRVATFTPFAPFFPTSTVSVTLTAQVTDSAGNPVVGSAGVGSNFVTSFITATNADISPPRVIVATPPKDSTGVNVNTNISLTFSEPIDVTTVTADSFQILVNGVPVAGRVTFDSGNTIVNFQPTTSFASLTEVQVVAASTIKDLAGNGLIETFNSRFVTQSGTDILRPRIIALSPINGQTGLPLNARIEVLFDEVIDPARITSTVVVRSQSGAAPPTGTLVLTPDGKGLILTFNAPLAPNKCYFLDVGTNAAAAIFDLAGNALLNPFTFNSFCAGTDVADIAAPSVMQVNPRDGATGFALNGVLQLQFSEPVAPSSINNQSIAVAAGGVPVPLEFGFLNGNRVITVKPANLFKWAPSTTFELQVTNNVHDLAGNALTPFSAIFTTGTADDTTRPSATLAPPTSTVFDPMQPLTFIVTFNEPVNPISIAGNFNVRRAQQNFTAGDVDLATSFSLSADQTVLTLTTQEPAVAAGRSVVVNLGTGISDIAGNALNGCTPCARWSTAFQTPVDPNQLFTAATVTANPTSLPAFGTATTLVTVSGINRSGALVPNGTKVAITVAPIYRADSFGGQIIEGTPSSVDSRFKVFTTLGGAVSFNYQALDLPNLTPGQTVNSFIQVVPLDGLDRPTWSVNNTAIGLFRSNTASLSSNPQSLLANGTSFAEVAVSVRDNAGVELPPGTRVGLSIAGIYTPAAIAGGNLTGGNLVALSTVDPRIQIHELGPGGALNLIYTTPTLAPTQSGNAVVEVVDIDTSGRAVGLFGSLTIGLNGASGATLPQPFIKVAVPTNGQSNVGRNAKVIFYFSKPLDPTTITTSTVQTFGYSATRAVSDGPAGPNSVLTLTPTVALAANTGFTTNLLTGIKSADGQSLLNVVSFSFSTGAGNDTTAPSITDITPPNNAVGVGLNQTISVYVNEAVNAATVTPESFHLLQNGTRVAGRIFIGTGKSGVNSLLTFVPDFPLAANTAYSIEVTAAITDTLGLLLTNPQITVFTTGARKDNARPSIIALSPINGQTGLPLNARIEVLFDEVIDPARITSTVVVRSQSGAAPPTGTLVLTPDGKGLILTFNAPLAPNKCYFLDVGTNAAAAIFDLAGNALLNPFTFNSFCAGTDVADIAAPSVMQVNPRDGATGFALNGVLQLQFSEPVAPSSINNQSIAVAAGGVPVPLEFGFLNGNRVITVKPANLFKWAPSTTFELQVTNNVHDLAGNALTPFSAIFTTGTADDTTRPSATLAPPTSTVFDPMQPLTFIVTFNEPVNPISIAGNFNVRRAQQNFTAGDVDLATSFSLSADQTVLTLTTQEPAVAAGRSVVVNLGTGISDIAGNALNGCTPCARWSTAFQTPVDPNQLFTAATVTANPTSLPAFGTATTLVTVSGINRSGALVPNGTKVAITVAPIYRADSFGGQIIEGTPSSVDSRFKVFTTLGGAVSFNYQALDLPNLTPGQTVNSFIQVVPLDGLDRPTWSVNNTAIGLFRSNTASLSSNPQSLLANGTSFAEVAVSVRDNAGVELPPGTRVGLSIAGIYTPAAIAGGNLTGGNLVALSTVDPRIQIHELGPGGALNLIYTTPTLAPTQSGNAVVEVVDIDTSGRAVGLFGSLTIGLNGASGATLPQPFIKVAVPTNGQSNVGRNAKVIFYFSKPLDPTTITTSTVQTFGYSATRAVSDGPAGPNSVLTLTPTVALAANTGFTTNLLTGIKSADGQSLLNVVSFSFSTGAGNDTTAPTVLEFNPANGTGSAPTNSAIKIQFSETINPLTISPSSVRLVSGGADLAYTFNIGSGAGGPNSLLRIIPANGLVGGTTYEVRVGSGIRDSVGLNVAPASASFTVGAARDTANPSVTSVFPAANASGVPLNQKIVVTFSESLDRTTFCCGNFRLSGPAGTVSGSTVWDLADSRLTFTPDFPLLAGRLYRIDIVGFRDIAGNGLTTSTTTFFTTALAPGTGALPTGASVLINPPEMYADGNLSAVVEVSNVNISGTLVANGTRIGITAQPVFISSSGGTISGTSVGSATDGRFLVFETLGAKVTANMTPPDLRTLGPGQSTTTSIQIVSLDVENNPSALIGSATITLYGIGSVALSNNDTSPSDNQADVLAVVKDLRGRLVTDGTRIGAKVVLPNTDTPVAFGALNGGSTSPVNPAVQIYMTTGGQTPVGFAGPAGQQCHLGVASGTKLNLNTGTLKVFTVDALGNELNAITSATIECFN